MSIEPNSLQMKQASLIKNGAASLLTEIILTNSLQSLGKIHLDWMPQPGNHLDFEGKTYTVLERHHHYQYTMAGYCLNKISLHVQESQQSTEKSLVQGRWVMGYADCIYNAHSEIIRCAVNPQGPCHACSDYKSSGSEPGIK